MSKFFVEILNSGIAIPTKYTKINVQETKMILQYKKRKQHIPEVFRLVLMALDAGYKGDIAAT